VEERAISSTIRHAHAELSPQNPQPVQANHGDVPCAKRAHENTFEETRAVEQTVVKNSNTVKRRLRNTRARARFAARVPQRLVPAPQLPHDENADENMTDETEEVWQTVESKRQRRLRTQVRVPLKFVAPPHLPGDERADENLIDASRKWGSYKCTGCLAAWESGCSWDDYAQVCIGCYNQGKPTYIKPFKTRPL
jgi:hypothetical protein